MLELILERSQALAEQDFIERMADFGTRPPAQRVLYMQGLTTAALTTLNRPGAWLLDYVYTVICVIYGDIQPTVRYSPVPNASHLDLLSRCFPDAAQSEHGCSNNNRGNQMEAMGWLTYEADRSELVLAMAYHSRRCTRKAELLEAGATGTTEDAGQASSQMEALLQYGAHLGIAYPSTQTAPATPANPGVEAATYHSGPTHQPSSFPHAGPLPPSRSRPPPTARVAAVGHSHVYASRSSCADHSLLVSTAASTRGFPIRCTMDVHLRGWR